ncbi:hypothetical protein GCM10009776_37980 [Microbacterium deminutum]|uniref:Uncharacterized protein n=1 Tax=Microbacterium deminutum TaxID=344164 RepID=A0ABN2RM11_9MICO
MVAALAGVGSIVTGIITKLWAALPPPLPGFLIAIGAMFAMGWVGDEIVQRNYKPEIEALRLRVESGQVTADQAMIEARAIDARLDSSRNWGIIIGLVVGFVLGSSWRGSSVSPRRSTECSAR